jgi:uncharacterized protein (TIGR02391 family)
MKEEADETGDAPAQIEYFGIAGGSLDCEASVVRLVLADAVPASCRILTVDRDHALLLTTDIGDLIAVKSGFASGYGGTGPSSFSLVLQMLLTHGCEIDEVEVEEAVMSRLDQSALTQADVDLIVGTNSKRPSRWGEYILDRHGTGYRDGCFWREIAPVVPYPLIDARIFDLALAFKQNPNDAISTGYRRLEELLRQRTGSSEHGHRLVTRAFVGEKSALHWGLADQGEHEGRASLFKGAFLAYRNPRAHRVLDRNLYQEIEEFLLLNTLFGLEKSAVNREAPVETDGANEDAGSFTDHVQK